MRNLLGSEHSEQTALINWFALSAKVWKVDSRLLFAIPNGAQRRRITGAMLKAEGVRAGIPDLFLAVPRGIYHGLFIEMKSKRGKLSTSQHEMIHLLAESMYCCRVCFGFDEARNIITRYLTLSEGESI